MTRRATLGMLQHRPFHRWRDIQAKQPTEAHWYLVSGLDQPRLQAMGEVITGINKTKLRGGKPVPMPSHATGPIKTHAVGALYQECGAPTGSGQQVKARSPKFNVPGWPCSTSRGSRNALGLGQVWLSNANRQAMVYFGDGGGNCMRAPPIGIDPGSAQTLCGGNQGESAVKTG